jgi:hypothetical protein
LTTPINRITTELDNVVGVAGTRLRGDPMPLPMAGLTMLGFPGSSTDGPSQGIATLHYSMHVFGVGEG